MKNGSEHLKLATPLTYCGTLPFIAASLGAHYIFWVFWPDAAPDPILLVRTYGAVIISFICGIHWGAYMFHYVRVQRNLFLTSNAITLMAWGSLMANPYYGILLLILGFLYLLTLDYKLWQCGVWQEWFYKLRRNATSIVVISLSALLIETHP